MSVYCGRLMSPDDIETIRSLISQDPSLTRAALSRKLCVLWQWLKPNGELKDMTCRVALARLQADGLIALPPSRMSAQAQASALPEHPCKRPTKSDSPTGP